MGSIVCSLCFESLIICDTVETCSLIICDTFELVIWKFA